MCIPVVRSIFDKRGGWWDRTKARGKSSYVRKIKVGQTDFSDHGVGVREQVMGMSEVLLQGVVDKPDGRGGLFDGDKP